MGITTKPFSTGEYLMTAVQIELNIYYNLFIFIFIYTDTKQRGQAEKEIKLEKNKEYTDNS